MRNVIKLSILLYKLLVLVTMASGIEEGRAAVPVGSTLRTRGCPVEGWFGAGIKTIGFGSPSTSSSESKSDGFWSFWSCSLW